MTLLWATFSVAALALIGPPLAALLYREPILPTAAQATDFAVLAGLATVGNARVGELAAWLALMLFLDPLFQLAQSCFKARRAMRQAALLLTLTSWC